MTFSSLEIQNFFFGSQHIRMPKDNEYDVFSKVTRGLQKAVISGNRIEVISAINMNNQLWTTLAADLSHSGNKLPDAMKAGLMSLAIFSINKGRQILSKDGSADALIDVNICMMKGLRGKVPQCQV